MQDSVNPESFRKALQSLLEVLEAPPSLRQSIHPRILQDSTIQRFKYTYELAWKMMKRTLEAIGNDQLDGVGRRDLFRMATEAKLIDNPDQWFEYLNARSRTSHAYDQEVANMILDVIGPFAKDAQELLAVLEARANRGE